MAVNLKTLDFSPLLEFSVGTGLAQQITDDSGALVSEIPIGQRAFRQSFVRRDRIQSGMALAVIPVQTDVTGGTMHTVKFAETQWRLLLCPKPLGSEHGLRQYAGIFELIRSGRAQEFQADQYESLFILLKQKEQSLLTAEEVNGKVSGTAELSLQHTEAHDPSSETAQVPFGFADDVSSTEADLLTEQIDRMVQISHELKLDSSATRFDQVTSAVRKKVFGSIRSKKGRPSSPKVP